MRPSQNRYGARSPWLSSVGALRGTNSRPAPSLANDPTMSAQRVRLRYDRGSLRLDAPRAARVPRYLIWDDRVSAWRTEAYHYLRVREDAASYHLTVDDEAPRFLECPTLQPALPRLR